MAALFVQSFWYNGEKEKKMLIIIGKSGSGKTSVVDELVNNYGYTKEVTDTTRPKRPGEVEGVDYNFLSQEKFDENKEAGLYAEDVVYNASFGQVSYGSRKDSYVNTEKSVIILNPYGLKQVIQSLGRENVQAIYLRLEDELILSRLAKRGDNPVEVSRRLETDRFDFSDIEKDCQVVIDVKEEDSIEFIAKNIMKQLKGGAI